MPPRPLRAETAARRRWAGVLVVVCLLVGVPVAGESVAGGAGCAGLFRFAHGPVPVAKTADGQTTLATVQWGYNAAHNLCYLVLDDAAVAVLRASAPQGRVSASGDQASAERCQRAYNPDRGFAGQPVPVAKTADGQTTLATVQWGYNAVHNLCYLVLDDAAVAALRAAHRAPVDCSGSQHCLVSLSGRSASGRWCGLRDDQTVMCTDPHGYAPLSWADHGPAKGRFASVSAGRNLACGVRVDQAAQCWTYNWQFESASSPEGRFTSVSAGIDWSDFACGIRTDRTAVCWGDNKHGRLDAPDGRFTSVSAGWEHACGIREDHTLVCWGDNTHGRLDAPQGQFTSVSAGFWFSCGIRQDHTATCWGNNLRRGYNAPQGQFQEVSAGQSLACGLRDDNTAVCWGPPTAGTFGELDAPPGQFASVSAGAASACGLRPDGTVKCWGDTTATTWPTSHASSISWCSWCSGPAKTTGKFEVHVFYCARQGKYTQTDLEHETAQFNQTIAPFYAQESGGLAHLEFIPAGIVSPDIDWSTKSTSSEHFLNPRIVMCSSEIQQEPPQSDLWHVLVLMDATVDEAFGYGYGRVWLTDDNGVGRAATVAEAATVESLSDWFDRNRWACLSGANCRQFVFWRYLATVTHELGHSLFGFDHQRDCSLMSIGDDVGCQPVSWETAMQTSNPLQTRFFIGCANRQEAGWPQDPNRCPQDP